MNRIIDMSDWDRAVPILAILEKYKPIQQHIVIELLMTRHAMRVGTDPNICKLVVDSMRRHVMQILIQRSDMKKMSTKYDDDEEYDDDEDGYVLRKSCEVSAEDFAVSLYQWAERNGIIDKKLRDEFIDISMSVIYDAMIATCGFGIKRR